jgi:hypothetical protein
MTTVVGGEWVLSQRWKRCATQKPLRGPFGCAQGRLLKRHSFTVVLAAVEVSSILVKIKIKGEVRGNVKGKVKGDGQECPSYTGNTSTNRGGLCPLDSRGRLSPHGCPQGLKPGFFFSCPDRHEWNSCPSRFVAAWVRRALKQSQQQVPFGFAQGRLSPGLRPCSE